MGKVLELRISNYELRSVQLRISNFKLKRNCGRHGKHKFSSAIIHSATPAGLEFLPMVLVSLSPISNLTC
jgi:hypothetical protein